MEINLGLTEIIIGVLGLILAYFGVGKVKKEMDNKKVEDAHEKVGASEANDEKRDDVINRANEVIQKNLKAIQDAKNILDNDDSSSD